MRKDRRERIGNDLSEYQKWVDYDMKKYGRISDITKGKIRKAGLSIVKDQYGDYEVIADRPIKEELKEARGEEELDTIAYELYEKRDDEGWGDFTDDELAILWSMCMFTKENPWGQPYDDEVYEEIYRRNNPKEIIQKARDILDGKVNESCSPRKLKEAKERHIKDLTDEELIALRKEIVLGSLFYRDYRNSFGIDEHEVCDFFEGFLDDAEDKFEGEFDRYPKDVNELYDYCDNDDDLIEYAYGIEW